jgi:hypothetical protein
MKRVAMAINVATLLLLTACASGPSRRVSEPAVNIQQLTVRTDGSWSLDLRIDNFSNVPMRFDNIALKMTIGGASAGTLQTRAALTIGPESADVATVSFTPSSAAKILIADALSRGSNLEYTLDGTVDAALEKGSARTYRNQRTNALSPVPGLAGVLR